MDMRKLFVPAIAVAAMVGSTSLATAAEVLKAADVHPLGYPTVEAVVSMGKKLSAATNGKYEIKMFPSMQLGSEEATLQQTQLGAIAITRVSVGPVGPIVDEVNVFNLPFVFRSEAHMRKVIDGEIGKELLGKITANPNANLVGLAWMDSGTRSVFNKVRPITKPEDLKGLKIRMMGNPLYVDTMNALGGTGVAMGMPEVYNGIATGVVDGAENNQPSYVSFNLISVAKYYSFTRHLMIPEILVMSKKIYNSMTPDEQKLVMKLAAEAQQEQRVLWDKKVAESMETMKKTPGVEINEISDTSAFQAAVKPVWDKYGAKYAKMIERIQAVQ
ncbi:MAG: TRAP transporter substrate-binding protein [Rhodospirillales bacterium]|jgi:tripartite ATP-independent transporter DctP family solute receptor|nr:TRAP transporter substrate-binding protein [Rhodospirillales bacterium]